MKFMPKVVAVVFTVIVGIFTFHQLAVGNPFQDEVPPFFVLLPFFILGCIGVYNVFSKAKKS